jgi:hypothetical protein
MQTSVVRASPDQATIFSLCKSIGIAGERLKRGTIRHDDPPAIAADRVLAFEDVERARDARLPAAQRVSQLLMRHCDLVALEAIMIQQDPARRTSLDRMDQVGCDGTTHLRRGDPCKA